MRPDRFMLVLLFAVGCSSTPPMPQELAWQGVQLTATEQKADPLPAARTMINERETAGNLDHAIALLNWHVERRPESADLHLLLAEAHSRAAEALDLQKKEDQGPHLHHRTEGLKHAQEALRLSPQSGPAHYWLA